MKKTTIILLMLISVFSYAQENKGNSKSYNNMLTFGVLGNSGLFIYKFSKSEEFKNRISLNGWYSETNQSQLNYYNRFPGVKVNRGSSYLFASIAYGKEYHVKVLDNLTFYYGLDIPISVYHNISKSGFEITDSVEHANYIDLFGVGFSQNDYSSYSTGHFVKNHTSEMGIGIGVRPILGLNLKVSERLMFGLEYQLHLAQVKYNFGAKYRFDTNVSEYQKYNHSYRLHSSINKSFQLSGRSAITVNYLF